jgi:hypothetical protein
MLRFLASLACLSALAACGGGDDAPAAAAAAGAASCETKQFAAGTVATVPTAAQWTSFARNLTVGATAVVLTSSGALTLNGTAVDLKSACYLTVGDMIMVSWGTANTVGAGNIVYDNHIDFGVGTTNGFVNGAAL